MAETIREYLDTVQEQIRWKRARPVVIRELEQHLADQRDAFLEEGTTQEAAERMAVEEMGDPVTVGTELDRVHRPKPQWGLLLPAVVSLCLWLGIQSLSFWGLSSFWDYILRDVMTALLAFTVMALLHLGDYTLLGRCSGALVALGSAAVLLIVLNYMIQWCRPLLYAGTYSIQLLLPAIVTPLAIYRLREKGTPGLAVCVLLCLLQLGEAVIWMLPVVFLPGLVCNTGLLCLAVKKGWFGRSCWNWALIAVYVLTVLMLMIRGGDLTGITSRYIALLRPETEANWWGTRAWEAISQARLVGMAEGDPLGLGEAPLHRLMTWKWDEFLLGILSLFGWLPFLALQVPMAVLLAAGWRKCLRQTAVLGRLLGTGILLTLTWQAVSYLLQTFTGGWGLFTLFPYPLLTDGGTALVLDCALLGILLSVFRSGSIVRENARRQAGERKNFQFP